MPAKICSVCGNLVLGPIAVAELSTIAAGKPSVERSLLCPECFEWARTFLRPQPVAESDRPTIPFDPNRLQTISRGT